MTPFTKQKGDKRAYTMDYHVRIARQMCDKRAEDELQFSFGRMATDMKLSPATVSNMARAAQLTERMLPLADDATEAERELHGEIMSKLPPAYSHVWRAALKTLAMPDMQKQRRLPLRKHIALPMTAGLMDLFLSVQESGDCAVVYGPSGRSKSYSVQKFASENSRVYALGATPSMSKTIHPMLKSIAGALGLQTKERQNYYLEKDIIRKLCSIHGHKLLLIDEANYLRQTVIDQIRRIYDLYYEQKNRNGNLGLILLGNTPLIDAINSSTDLYTAQIKGRIGKYHNMARVSDSDTIAVLEEAMGSAKLSDRILNESIEVANSPGGLHILIKVLRDALALAESDGESLCAEHIRTARLARAADSGNMGVK